MKKKYFFILIYFYSSLIYSQSLNSFSSGDPVSASKFNENFNQLLGLFDITEMSAMMICSDLGKKDEHDTGDYYFTGCGSTDNQTFETIQYYGMNYNYKATNNNAISLQNIFNNKWILQQSVNMSSSTNKLQHIFIFYKSK